MTTKKKVDKKLVKKWITALESGKYRQCTGALHNIAKNSFCALGVLCDVYDPTKWEKGHFSYCYVDNDTTTFVTLPRNIKRRLCLHYTKYDKIMKMNDTNKKSFKEIAKYIREIYNIKG